MGEGILGEGTLGAGGWLVLFLTVQRLAELAFAYVNTVRLRKAGAVEFGQSHYPLMVTLHGLWLVALWVAGHGREVSTVWLVIFIVLQAGRVWVIATLGRRWTTRIIVVPRAPAVAGGPYRWLRHPNYLIVALEIAVVPLALGLPLLAAIFSLANAAMLYQRIKVENAALLWAVASVSGVQDPAPTLANGGARR
jgi:methyltransferase